VIRVAAAVVTLLVLLGSTTLPPAASDSPGSRELSRAHAAFRVTRTMTMSDPIRSPGNVARQLRTYI